MRKSVIVFTKFKAIAHFKRNQSKKQKARLFNVTAEQIREWVQNEEMLIKKAAQNRNKLPVHNQSTPAEEYFEQDGFIMAEMLL